MSDIFLHNHDNVNNLEVYGFLACSNPVAERSPSWTHSQKGVWGALPASNGGMHRRAGAL
jgi:hypothetical protein